MGADWRTTSNRPFECWLQSYDFRPPHIIQSIVVPNFTEMATRISKLGAIFPASILERCPWITLSSLASSSLSIEPRSLLVRHPTACKWRVSDRCIRFLGEGLVAVAILRMRLRQAKKAADVLRSFLFIGDETCLEKCFANLGNTPCLQRRDARQLLFEI